MSLTEDYIRSCREIIESVSAQEKQIQEIAERFANSILNGRVVHLFG